MTKTVPELLRDGANTYEERNAIYGDNYKRHGIVMRALFPNGVVLRDTDDHNRFGVLTQMVAKLTRYCENWNRGGHADSLHDEIVYSGMLAELDGEIEEQLNAFTRSSRTHISSTEVVVEQKPKETFVINEEAFLADRKPASDSEPNAPGRFDEAEVADAIIPEEAPSAEPPAVIPEPPAQK